MTKNLEDLVNDPFEGKKGFMPKKIKEKIDVRVGLNENLAFPEELIKQSLLQAAKSVDPRLYPEDYCDSLRELLAKEHQVEPSQIIIGNGGDKIIDLVVRLTLSQDKSAVVVQPTYPMYEHAILLQGGTMTEAFLTPAPDFQLDVEAILNTVNPEKDKLLFLCSPNNPTGNQFDKERIIEIINRFHGIVALDETYASFGDYSFIDTIDEFPNLVIMKSLSKFHGMAGMRVGYAIADEFLINRMTEMLPAFNVNAVSQALAKLVVQQKGAIQQVVTTIIEERQRIFDILDELPQIKPYPSYTNFILFKTEGIKVEKVEEELLKKYGVMVRNMSTMPLLDGCLRVTVTTEENNQKFLDAITQIIS
jgi:histidinol-phosphate aminotransferase